MSSDTETGPVSHSVLLQNKLETSAVIDSSLSVNKRAIISNTSLTNLPMPGTYNDDSNSDSDLSINDNTGDRTATSKDYVEYNFSNLRGNESYTVLDRGFSNVESQYNDRIQNGMQTKEESPNVPRESSPRKIKQKELDINEDSDDDDWKEINTQLDCGDIYNLKGEKIDSFIHSDESLTNERTGEIKPTKKKKKKGSAVGKKVVTAVTGIKIGKDDKLEELNEKYHKAHVINGDKDKQGYTRIDIKEQAVKFGEMDKKFDFLFQNENSNLRKLHQQANTSSTELVPVDEFVAPDKFDDVFQNEGRSDNQLDPNTQMMSTKSMLDDSQKIAYAALVKLIIVQLNTDLAQIRGSGSTSIMKKLAMSNKSFMRWSMSIMDAVYDHLSITKEEERVMIETLSCHGVETMDLTKVFNKKLTIENHLDEEKDNLQMINVDNDEENKEIEVDIKWTLICDLFLILLEASVYDSRSRTLLMNFADSIGIQDIEIYQFERRITDSLEIDDTMEIMQNQQIWNEKDILKQHKKKDRNRKIVKIALATVAGGLVIGLSAGALAPVIGAGMAAGLTTIGIGGTSGFLAGTAGTAVITTGGVLSGMRAGGVAMNNRAGSVKTFEFIPLHNNKRVNLILTVSGWMSGEMDDIRLPFSTVDQVMGDLYSLLWEPEMLTSTGQTIGILANEVLTQSIQQILGNTLLITLMAGLQLPMMLSKLGYLLDNPWNVSLDRAWSAGLVLADTLRMKKLGSRPITLVGFSLGARLIYSCLLSLAKSGDFGLIENVYLFGSPFVTHEDEIALARSCVSGKFINGYLKQDWILGYLFRATSGGLRSIAGLSPIDSDQYNIENIDCSEYVTGHMQYRESMPKLLKLVNWEVSDDKFVEIDQPNPEEEERQRKLLSDFEKAQHGKKKKGWYNKWFGKGKNTEWWEMYEEGEKEKKEKGKNESTNFDVDALQREVLNIEREAEKKAEKEAKKKAKKEARKKGHEPPIEEAAAPVPEISIEEEETPIGIKTPELKPQKQFHFSPDHHQSPKVNLSPKELKNRKSMIQLVETNALEINLGDNKPLSQKIRQGSSNIGGDNQLKTFRISSQHTEVNKTIDNQKPFGFNIFHKHESTEEIAKNDILTKSKPNGRGLGFDIVQVTKEPINETTPIPDLPAPLTSPAGKTNSKIDYGDDDDFGGEEKIQIEYGDAFENLEDKVRKKHRNKAGFGPTTEINYGDEDEFPEDERNINVTFS